MVFYKTEGRIVQIYNAMGDDKKKETKIEKKDEFGNTVEEKKRKKINTFSITFLFVWYSNCLESCSRNKMSF